jgi:hypothetical protein
MPVQEDKATGSSVLREGAEVILHSWKSQVRVLSNPAARRGVALSLGVGAFGLEVLFLIISKSIAALYLAAGLFGGLMCIFVLVGGVLNGSLTGMATETLARSEQDVSIFYGDVTAVKVNQRRHYLTVRGSWSQKPIGLYCGDDDFTEILRLLKGRCPLARFN